MRLVTHYTKFCLNGFLVHSLLTLDEVYVKATLEFSDLGKVFRPRKTSERRPIFRARTFSLANKKNSFDLQISSQINKRMKKLQQILNVSIISVYWFADVYIFDDVKSDLSAHGLRKI